MLLKSLENHQNLTKDTPWSARDDMLSIVQLADVLPNVGATNTGMTLHIHVVTQCQDHLQEKYININNDLKHIKCHTEWYNSDISVNF